MTIEQKFANALRTAALRLEYAIEFSHHETSLDANDLIEMPGTIADRLPPLVPTEPTSLLDAAQALLEAQKNQIVTRVEWERLAQAVAAQI